MNQKAFSPIAIILIVAGVLIVGGGAYWWQKVKIPAIINNSISNGVDESEVAKNLAPVDSIKFLSPSKGERLKIGQNYKIKWTPFKINLTQYNKPGCEPLRETDLDIALSPVDNGVISDSRIGIILPNFDPKTSLSFKTEDGETEWKNIDAVPTNKKSINGVIEMTKNYVLKFVISRVYQQDTPCDYSKVITTSDIFSIE